MFNTFYLLHIYYTKSIHEMDMSVVPIHKYPKYLQDCCALINDEWKRSETARLRSLESSCDDLPVNLILLQHKEVIGHVKLTKIPSISKSCFVESVVIDKKLRGKGYGTYLMKETEKYCQKALKLNIIYLSTKGQELFYEKLGYERCQPVSIYGGYINNNFISNIPTRNSTSSKVTNCPPPPPLPKEINNKVPQKTFMCKNIQ